MRKFRIGALCLVLLLLLPLVCGCGKENGDALRITVLNVGQSDCILLSVGERHMLIDTGTASERAAVLGELSARGIKELAYVLVTHPHEDHYGNARAVLETHTVGALMVSNEVKGDAGYELLLQSAQGAGVALRRMKDGDVFSFGGARCEVFCAFPEDPEGNNASLVLRVTFGTCVLLFMGDAESEAEEMLLSREIAWECDFLKAGHHGSRTACTEAFLAAAKPKIVAISCGKDNDYGFPHREVLSGLAQIGARICRTDEQGTLDFICDGETVVFEE